MAANLEAKVAYLGSPWSDFNDFCVYSKVFNVSELIALVFKMIVHEGHSQKVILKVKFKKCQIGRLFTQDNELVADCIPLKC